MVTKIKSAPLTIKETDSIEKVMYEKGYLTHEYITPPRTTETDIKCPVCGENLNVYVSGNSHQIKCKTDSCVIITFRGL